MVTSASGFLIDTNVISELMKARPSRRVADWINETPEDLLYMSVITIGEVRKGLDLLDHEPKRAALHSSQHPGADRPSCPACSAGGYFSERQILHGRPDLRVLQRSRSQQA